MIETIAMAAVGLAFAAFIGIVLIVVGVAIYRATRSAPPPPAALQQAQPVFIDSFRAPASPPPSFLDGMVQYGNQRKAEIDRDKYRDALDVIAGITTKAPGVAPPNA